MNKDQKNLMRNINNRLRKNWRILEQLNPIKKQNRGRSLLHWGSILIISPVFIPPKQAMSIILCMINSYLPLDNDFFALVKRD